jgi:hypothetical protein
MVLCWRSSDPRSHRECRQYTVEQDRGDSEVQVGQEHLDHHPERKSEESRRGQRTKAAINHSSPP